MTLLAQGIVEITSCTFRKASEETQIAGQCQKHILQTKSLTREAGPGP